MASSSTSLTQTLLQPAEPAVQALAAAAEVPPPPAALPEGLARAARKREGLRLGETSQVAELRRRPFICGYYRLDAPCVRDFVCCHNELGNIWTHVIAALLILVQLGLWCSEWHVGMSWTLPQAAYRVGVLLFFLGSFATFCVSVQYHWKMCSTDKEFLRWMCLDQSSCLVLVVIGFFSGVPMGFHCFTTLQIAYTSASVAICLFMMAVVMTVPKDRWDVIAAVVIFGTILGAVIPAIHWLIVSEPG
eukprot:TRINITY_DN22775_c0_g2_i2.p1 TRINITY_DN22775_c0_g2~~TRINITY_DN22775_c0_g2_i2.p1  ORF type:complete len:256 (+),score=44.04 TRINITY_DN22775_c0_g2_i2:30-770(+)